MSRRTWYLDFGALGWALFVVLVGWWLAGWAGVLVGVLGGINIGTPWRIEW